MDFEMLFLGLYFRRGTHSVRKEGCVMLFKRVAGWPRWGSESPFEELSSLRRQMDWLNNSLSRGSFREPAAGVFPLLNVTEDKDSYYVRAELPGLKADELEISVTGDSLSISGERKLPVEDEKAQYHRRERDAGRFSRIVSLPAQINTGNVEAHSNDGVLTVVLPKAEEAKPRQISVKSS
jgi:HSP20 family protein